MNLLNIVETYPDELSCRLKFKEIREKKGIVCAKCGCTEHFWRKKQWLYICKKCGFITTIRSGTVMQSSKLSFRYWFITMHLLTSKNKKYTAKDIQRLFSHSRYQPILCMIHKIRKVMTQSDEQYKLSGKIELDQEFLINILLRPLVKK